MRFFPRMAGGSFGSDVFVIKRAVFGRTLYVQVCYSAVATSATAAPMRDTRS